MVELFERTIGLSYGLRLDRTEHAGKKKTYKHVSIGIRIDDQSVRTIKDGTSLRLYHHCGGLYYV
jgi:hypothetical protein